MNRAEFEMEVARCLPALRSIARRMVGVPSDAEDVVQDALLRASQALDTFRHESSLKTWLTSVTTRTAIDHLRERKRWSSQPMIDACDPSAGPAVSARFAAAPEARFEARQHISLCFTCVGRTLEPLHQAALVLSELCGFTDRESAQMLELTEPTFRRNLSAARDAMRVEFEGLCALVGKGGACHQCRVLRALAPVERAGAPAPELPSLDARLTVVREQELEPSALNAYFFETLQHLQRRG